MLVMRYIQQLKVPMLSSSGNIPCLSTVVQHVHIQLLGVSWLTPDLINRPTAYLLLRSGTTIVFLFVCLIGG